MIKTLILVCAMDMAPMDCQIETALDVISGPDAASEVMCALHGQAYMAETGLMERRKGEYLKIRCTRTGHPKLARAQQNQ